MDLELIVGFVLRVLRQHTCSRSMNADYNSSFFTPSNVFISVHRNVKAENYSASSSSSKLTIRLLGNRFGSSFHCGSVINDRSCDMGDGLAFGFKNIVYYEVSFQKMTLFELNPCLYCVV